MFIAFIIKIYYLSFKFIYALHLLRKETQIINVLTIYSRKWHYNKLFNSR